MKFTRIENNFYDTAIIDLSKNVCIDNVLNNKVKNIISEMDISQLMNYADEPAIIDSISSYFNIGIDRVEIGLGATEIISRLIFLMKKEKISILCPTFAMVKVYCDIYEVDTNIIQYNQYNIEDLIGDHCLYIASPNGINGHTFSKEEIEYICKNTKFLILDESYIEFSKIGSYIKLIEKYKNIAIVRSFSKMISLAGSRCGICFSNPDLILLMRQVSINRKTSSLSNIIPYVIHDTKLHVNRMYECLKVLDMNDIKYEVNCGNFVLLNEFNKNKLKNCKCREISKDLYRLTFSDTDTYKKII